MNSLLLAVPSARAFRSPACALRLAVRSVVLVLLATGPGGPGGLLQAADTDESDQWAKLKTMDFSDLLKVEITSVSKRSERLFESPAAVYSISADDIQRSGARSFADALRLSPGMSVAQQNGSDWAVTARGFNDVIADKLLVLMDGRTLYSPATGGVTWNTVDYLFEDIERVEVVRGPGGTLWGANAVNGVINILSKDARDTQGFYSQGGGGSYERGFGGARYGAKLSENGYGRVYMKYRLRDELPGADDPNEMIQGGFRTDWHLPDTHFTLQGDAYSERHYIRLSVPEYTPPYLPLSRNLFVYGGASLRGRMQHEFGENSTLEVQGYYDRTELQQFDQTSVQQIWDLDAQHRLRLPPRHTVIYGAGYRYTPDHLATTPYFTYDPVERRSQVINAFVQDEIELVEDQLRLTLGTKAEHNDYTGLGWSPSARLAWLPTKRQTVWLAASRSQQVPTRGYNDLTIPALAIEPVNVNGLPLFTRGQARRGLEAQELISYELGYRVQATDTLTFDLAGYYNFYDNLLTADFGDVFFEPTPAPHLVLPIRAANGGKGETHGFEVSAQWQAAEWWRWSLAYSYQQFQIDGFNHSFTEGRDPQNQVSLRWSIDVPVGRANEWRLDVWGRYVDRLPAFPLPSYFDLDVRLAWRPNPRVELAVVGQNLVESRRLEFSSAVVAASPVSPVARGVYGELSVRF